MWIFFCSGYRTESMLLEMFKNMYVARYESLAFDLKGEMRRMANCLKLEKTDGNVNGIYDKCNIENRKKFIMQIDYSNKKYNNKTLLQCNHIHSEKSLQWKFRLAKKQVNKVEEAKEWFQRNNYTLSNNLFEFII